MNFKSYARIYRQTQRKSAIDSTIVAQKKNKMGIKFIPFSPSAVCTYTVKILFSSHSYCVFNKRQSVKSLERARDERENIYAGDCAKQGRKTRFHIDGCCTRVDSGENIKFLDIHSNNFRFSCKKYFISTLLEVEVLNQEILITILIKIFIIKIKIFSSWDGKLATKET